MLILASCTAAPSPSDYYNPINGNSDGKASYEYPSISEKPAMEQIGNYDKEKKGIVENQFIKTSENAVSTFSADVDTASYTLLRRLLKNNYSLDEIISTAGDSIRTEELVNYFKYDYKKPAENELFGVSCKLTPHRHLVALLALSDLFPGHFMLLHSCLPTCFGVVAVNSQNLHLVLVFLVIHCHLGESLDAIGAP